MRKCLLFFWFACNTYLGAQENPHPAISPVFFGQNAWMPDSVDTVKYYGQLHFLWEEVAESGVRLIRVGGRAMDSIRLSSYQLIKMVDSIRTYGMEPILQVPYFKNKYSAEQAAEMVLLLNISLKKNVRFWSIGNEPDLYTTPYNDIDTIVNYTRRFAAAMKAADSTIKIIGPACSGFIPNDYAKLVGGSKNITGLIPGHTYCYVDYVDFHIYPLQKGTQLYYRQVFDKMLEPYGFKDKLYKLSMYAHLASTSANRGDSLNNPVKTAITEFNIDYLNPLNDTFFGLGAESFVGGQFWAEAIRYCLRDSLSFLNFWSIREGGSTPTNIGYLDADNGGAFQPTFHHFRELSKNFSGNFLRDTSNQLYLKAITAKSNEGIHVMILNQDSAAYDSVYTIFMDWSDTPTGNRWIKIDAGLTGRIFEDTLGYMSTVHLAFDNYGNISQKTWYRRYMDHMPVAGFHQETCPIDLVLTNQVSLNNFYPGIYKSIAFGNGSNSITLSNTNNTVFRSSGSMVINGPFDSGLSEFQLLPADCK